MIPIDIDLIAQVWNAGAESGEAFDRDMHSWVLDLFENSGYTLVGEVKGDE